MSIDHKPNTREERTRIEDAGGVVVWAGTWRVGGVLAVSRAFGDRPLKRYVIPTPDIREEVLTEADECLILASDGLWDVISNQVRPLGRSTAAAREHTQTMGFLCQLFGRLKPGPLDCEFC
jgi:protein phosphatase 1L